MIFLKMSYEWKVRFCLKFTNIKFKLNVFINFFCWITTLNIILINLYYILIKVQMVMKPLWNIMRIFHMFDCPIKMFIIIFLFKIVQFIDFILSFEITFMDGSLNIKVLFEIFNIIHIWFSIVTFRSFISFVSIYWVRIFKKEGNSNFLQD